MHDLHNTTDGYLAFGENTRTQALASELADLRARYAKWIRWASSSSLISQVLRKYDALKCTILNMHDLHHGGYLAFGEDTRTLRLTSELVDLRVGYAKWIRRTSSPSRISWILRRYDALECIISTEGYRSGHNEAVLKTVWACAHVGSNPTPSARKKHLQKQVLFLIKSAFCGIDPLPWMKSLRDEICLTAG